MNAQLSIVILDDLAEPASLDLASEAANLAKRAICERARIRSVIHSARKRGRLTKALRKAGRSVERQCANAESEFKAVRKAVARDDLATAESAFRRLETALRRCETTNNIALQKPARPSLKFAGRNLHTAYHQRKESLQCQP